MSKDNKNEIVSGIFTQDQIDAANRRHDSKYGWSFAYSKLYPRMTRERFPELFYGEWPSEAHKFTEQWKAKNAK